MLPRLAAEFGAGGDSLASQLRARVKTIRFRGNTVFSDRELGRAVAKYTGREITAAELDEARQALTLKYVEAGFINSGAVLPDQDLGGGVLVFEIAEGWMSEVELHGHFWFRPWFLRHELRRHAFAALGRGPHHDHRRVEPLGTL